MLSLDLTTPTSTHGHQSVHDRPTTGNAPGPLFGGVDQLIREGQQRIFRDESQLALGHTFVPESLLPIGTSDSNKQEPWTAEQIAARLRIEEGRHYVLQSKDELPLDLVRNLGHGGCANVEEVRDRDTRALYAQKVFQITGSHAERQQMFDNEVKVIQRLSQHHHIIQVFATYVSKSHLGLILTPVANGGSLDMYIQDILRILEVTTLGLSLSSR